MLTGALTSEGRPAMDWHQRERLRCKHKRTRLVRVIFRNGRGYVMEQCEDCGENVRGAGAWVPRAQVPGPISELPVWKDRRPRYDQPSLFDGM
jgi:hypothetical protein